MSQIVDDLRQVAIEIKTETQVGGNTAARVGGAFERVADALEGTQQIEDMDEAVAAVQQAAQENEQTIQDIVNSLAVVQEIGQSTSDVMSQKAVTDAVDKVSNTIFYFKDFALPTVQTNRWINDSNKWASRSNCKYYLIPVTAGDVYQITTTSEGAIQLAWLTSNSTSGAASYVTGTGKFYVNESQTRNFTAPLGANYLYILAEVSGVVRLASIKIRDNYIDSMLTDIDNLENDVVDIKDLIYKDIYVPFSIKKSGIWINDSGAWESRSGSIFTLLEVHQGDTFYCKGNGYEPTYMYWLSSYQNPSGGNLAPVVEDTAKFYALANGDIVFTAPLGAKYLYLLYQIAAGRNSIPSKFQLIKSGDISKEETEIYYNGEKIYIGNRLNIKLIQSPLSDSQSGGDNQVEGFALIDGYAIATRPGGYISLYSFDKEKESFYYQWCYGADNSILYNNAANWGKEKYIQTDPLPLLYVTRSGAGSTTTQVYRVGTSYKDCTLVQTIVATNIPSVSRADWAIDKERGKIILYTNTLNNPDDDTPTTFKAKHGVFVWSIPALRDGNDDVVSSVVLDYTEAEEAYFMEDQPNNNTGYDDNVGYMDAQGNYTWIYQGVCAKNGKLIIPCGGYSPKRIRGLRVWDMDAKKQVNYIDLTNPIYDNHPYWEIEDCDVGDDGAVYIMCRAFENGKTFSYVYKLEFD